MRDRERQRGARKGGGERETERPENTNWFFVILFTFAKVEDHCGVLLEFIRHKRDVGALYPLFVLCVLRLSVSAVFFQQLFVNEFEQPCSENEQ